MSEAKEVEFTATYEHEHTWGTTGLIIQLADGRWGIFAPCLHPSCDKAIAIDKNDHMTPLGMADRWPTAPAGVPLDIEDDPEGGVYKLVYWEIEHTYRLHELELPPHPFIVDIGAHVGVVSCYLAKRFPDALIFSFEPNKENYERLVRNRDTNGVGEQITTFNFAAAGTSGDAYLGINPRNSGGHALASEGRPIKTMSLADILTFARTFRGRDFIDLLKIDCEGAEYEILMAPDAPLHKIGRIIGELHNTTKHQPQELLIYLKEHAPDLPYNFGAQSDIREMKK